MPKATCKARVLLQKLHCEFSFDEAVQMISYRWMIETLDDFVQKAGDKEALGDLCGNAASAQIEEFVFINLAGRCAMSATDVVGEDFQSRH